MTPPAQTTESPFAGGLSGARARAWAWLILPLVPLAQLVLYSPWAEARHLNPILAESPSLVMYALGTTFSALAASRTRGRDRRFWIFLALISGLQLIAEAMVDVQSSMGTSMMSSVTASSVAGLFSLAGTVVVFVLLFTMSPLANRPVLERIRAVVDLLIGIALGLVVAQLWVVGPVMAQFGVPFDAQILADTRVVVGVFVLAGVATNIFGFQGRRWHSWDRFVATALTLFAVGAIMWPAWYLAEVVWHSWLGNWAGAVIFALGEYFIFMGALYRLTTTSEPLERPRMPVASAATSMREAFYLPVILLAGTSVAFLFGWTDVTSRDSQYLVLPLVAFMLTLLCVRTALLRASAAGAAQAALVDPVTGVYAPAALDGFLQSQYEFARAAGEHLSLVELDLDDFGRVNDRAGHGRRQRARARRPGRGRRGSGRFHRVPLGRRFVRGDPARL